MLISCCFLVSSLALVNGAVRAAVVQQSPAGYETDGQVVYKTVASSDYKIADEYKQGGEPEYVQIEGGGGGGGGGYKQQEYQQPEKAYPQDKAYPHSPYGFGYNIDDGYGNKQWRHEKSANPHQVTGTYGYKDKNGIMREVEYVADKNGFRAVVKTTEPGTAPKDPAYVKMNANPIQVPYHPKQSYGKGQQDLYHQPQGGYGGQEGVAVVAAGYGQQKAAEQYAAGSGGTAGAGSGYQKNEGAAGYGKSMDGYENEYSSQATSKTQTAKYQDKK